MKTQIDVGYGEIRIEPFGDIDIGTWFMAGDTDGNESLFIKIKNNRAWNVEYGHPEEFIEDYGVSLVDRVSIVTSYPYLHHND